MVLKFFIFGPLKSFRGSFDMKKILFPMATAAIALSLFGCDKSGTVSGQVLDAFTGKPVEMPTVWMDSTIYGTQSQNYAYKDLLKEGKFKFEGVKVGTYLIKARRNKYILGQQKFTTSNENPNLEITLYEYPDTVSPGMYMAGAEGGTKVTNSWAIFSTTCKESLAGLRTSFEQDMSVSAPGQKDKKKSSKKDIKVNKLPDPKVMDASFDVLYCNPGSVTAAIEAAAYPAVSAPVSAHADCQGFENDKKGIFPDISKKTELAVEYKAEGLFSVKGTLPQGKQLVVLTSNGKTLQSYYVEVK